MTFSIGNDRILKLQKNDEIRILDKTTKKEAVFTSVRWASFLLCLDEIDNHLCKLTQGEDLTYQNHYGGGWYVSLTKGFSASICANSTCCSGKPPANLAGPASRYASANGHPSSRPSPTYTTTTTRKSPTSHRVSTPRTTRLHRVSPHVKSADRFLPSPCNCWRLRK